MYAFLSHTSACEALRSLGNAVLQLPSWPKEPRELPRHYQTVTTQRMFKEFSSAVDLAAYGITRSPVDLLVPKASQRSRGKLAHFHAWNPNVPAHALLRLEETLFVSTPEFVLLQMAGTHTRKAPIADKLAAELHERQDAYAQAGINEHVPYDDPFEWHARCIELEMILIATEFMGSYRLGSTSMPTTYQLKPIMTRTSMNQFVSDMPRMYGRNRLDVTMDYAFPQSASPMETALALLLSLPKAYGGYGLPKPVLNRKLPVSNHERLWAGGPSIRPDLLWENAKLAIEYDSNEEHGDAGPRKLADDAARANVLTSMGYSVLRVTTLNIMSPDEVDRLAQLVADKLGVTFAEVDEALQLRRKRLHELLVGA